MPMTDASMNKTKPNQSKLN